MTRTVVFCTILMAMGAASSTARAGSVSVACTASDDAALGDLAAAVESAAATTEDVSRVATVNGKTLAMNERFWLAWTAATVFPALPDDLSCSQKIDLMSHVYWWSLKEGDLGADNPPSYSNCMDDGKQHSWKFVCPGMWQVGFGVQAWDHPMSEVLRTAERAYGSEQNALRAAYDASGLLEKGVSWNTFLAANRKSSRLRRSWLERAPAVGYLLEDGDVVSGCIDDDQSWCHAPRNAADSWPEAERYGETISAARRAMKDTRALFAARGLCE